MVFGLARKACICSCPHTPMSLTLAQRLLWYRLDLVGPRVGYRIPTQADAVIGVRGYSESRRSRGRRHTLSCASVILWNHIVALGGVHPCGRRYSPIVRGPGSAASVILRNHIVALGGVHPCGRRYSPIDGPGSAASVILWNHVVALSVVHIREPPFGPLIDGPGSAASVILRITSSR